MFAGYAFWALNTGELGFTLSKAPALVLALACLLAVAAAVELGIFRPLRNTTPLAKLVASLGVLLTLQAAMLISFTHAPPPRAAGAAHERRPHPRRRHPDRPLHHRRNRDRRDHRARRCSTAGRASGWPRERPPRTRSRRCCAGSRRRGSALANSLIAALIAGRSRDPRRGDHRARHRAPAAPDRAGARGRAARRDSPRSRSHAPPASASAIALLAADLMSGLSWFPTAGGMPLPGVTELLALLIIMAAMYFRGGSLPGRGQLVEQRPPRGAPAEAADEHRAAARGRCARSRWSCCRSTSARRSSTPRSAP